MIILDFLLSILYVGFPFLWVLYVRSYRITNSEDKFFYLFGFLLKIFGAVVAGIIYVYYYKGGDTIEYFNAGKALLDFLFEHPDQLVDVFMSRDLRNYSHYSYLTFDKVHPYWGTGTTFIISKIAMITNFFTFNSFFLTSILCSYFSFYVSWQFYSFITHISDINKKWIGFAIFFVPSVVFWGSGLFKDTFTLCGLYLFIIAMVQLFAYNRFRWKYILFLVLGYYLLYNIRTFYIMIATPFIFLWIISVKYYSLKSKALKFLSLPIFAVVSIVSIYFVLNTLTSTFEELSVENLVDKTKGFQGWHTTLQGSAYSLGDIEYTLSGFIRKMPASIIVTFFRPFLWEANKAVIMLSAVQSLFFLLFTLYLLLRMKFIYFFTSLFKSPEAIALLGFSLFYGVIVGFTSYNFGALDRYKIPCLSTYIMALFFIYNTYLKHLRR